MPDIEFTAHARDMLIERNIPEAWVWSTINQLDEKRMGVDGNIHYVRAIRERGNRFLHIVVNPNVYPNRIVTVFFDRRLGRKK